MACTGSNNPMLAGNVAALLSPIVLVALFTLIFGIDKYDWKSMMDIRRGDDHDLADAAGLDLEEIPGSSSNAPATFEQEQKGLERASKISKSTTVVMVSPGDYLMDRNLRLTGLFLQTLALLVLWPMPLYGSGYIFSKPFFTGWVSVGIIWILCSFIGVGLFPIFEGRKTLARTCKYIYFDLAGKSHPKTIQAQEAAIEGQNTPGDATPTEKAADKEVITSKE